MTGNLVTLIMRLLDERLNFFQCEGWRDNQRPVWCKREIIIGVKLDPVGAIYELFTDPFARVPWVVDGFQHRRQRNIAGVPFGAKAACCLKTASRNLQAGALHQSV